MVTTRVNHVLIVAYYFPPIGGIGSIRMAGFAAHLPEFGWQPTVLAPAETPHPNDHSLSFLEDSVVRSRSIEVSSIGSMRTPHGGSGVGRDDYRLRLRRAGRSLVFPDAQIGWYPGAVRAGLRTLRGHSFDAVYSSSFPITAHLVGGTLARSAALPWIAEFRDPWSDRLGTPHGRRLAAAVERLIASRATRLVAPNPSLAEHFSQRWGREVAVVSNGCDPIPAFEPPPEPGATITHLGTHYPGRQDLSGLWEALGRVLRSDPGAVAQIRFVGALSEEARAEAARCGLEHLVEETGYVSHEEAMRLIATSTLLFSGGERGRDAIARGVVPAKLFEYLATDRPILYLGDPAGDAAQLLEGRPGCWVIDPGDVDAIADAVRSGLGSAAYPRDASSLTRRAKSRLLADVLDDAMGP